MGTIIFIGTRPNSGTTARHSCATLGYTYDAAGQLTQATDPSATYHYTYDALGRITNNSQTIAGLTPTVTYASTFNALGSLTSLAATIGSTADFKNTYVYDQLQRLSLVNTAGVTGGDAVAQKRSAFSYDSSGLVTKLSRYADLNGQQHVASSHYLCDGMGRLAETGAFHEYYSAFQRHSWGTGPLAGYHSRTTLPAA